MRNNKKIRLVFLLLFTFALTFALSLTASATAPRVMDEGGMLSAAEEAALSEKLDKASEKYGVNITVATVMSHGYLDIRDYAHDYYHAHWQERKGIIALYSRDGYYAVYATEAAMDIFSESQLDTLDSLFHGYLRDGLYYEGFDAFSDKCERMLKYDKRLTPIWIAISLAVGAATAGIVIWRMTSKHKNVNMQRAAENYMLRNTFRLDRSRDVFLYSHVTRIAKPKNNSSSGGRSRGLSGGRSGSARGGRV